MSFRIVCSGEAQKGLTILIEHPRHLSDRDQIDDAKVWRILKHRGSINIWRGSRKVCSKHGPFVPWRDSCGFPLQASAFNGSTQTVLVRKPAVLCSPLVLCLWVCCAIAEVNWEAYGSGIRMWPRHPVSRQSSLAMLFVCCFW